MSDEWWNKEHQEMEGNTDTTTGQPDTSMDIEEDNTRALTEEERTQKPEVREELEQAKLLVPPTMQNDPEVPEAAEPLVQPEVAEMPEPPVQPEVPEMPEQPENTQYHWVNPEYQKRKAEQDLQMQNMQNPNAQEPQMQNPNAQEPQMQNIQNPNIDPQYQQSWNPQTQKLHHQDPSQGWSGGSYQEPQFGSQGPRTGERRYGNYAVNHEESNPAAAEKQKKPMGTGKKFLVNVGMAVVFGVVAGGIMLGMNRLGGNSSEPAGDVTPVPTVEMPKPEVDDSTIASDATQGGAEYTVQEVAKNCMPSIVAITNASVERVQDFFGGVQEYPSESSGSGIIVGQNDTELLIATNNHVVEGANTLSVAFSDDAVYEAQIKGTDKNNDLAVISVQLKDMTEETRNAIKVINIGDSESLAIGEQVVAIGNALGYGQSVTSGWISAVGREMLDEEGNTYSDLIQTDAAINPGNSGGALLNMKGELIGINSAKAAATEVEGMGYAIPIAKAKPILDEMMNRQTRYKVDENKASYIGITCMDVNANAVQMYGIPQGAFVDSVEDGGPAQKAGIQKGDVIVKFDGLSISGSKELVNKLEYYEAGETVEVVVSRAEGGEYKEHTLTVTLGNRKNMTQQTPQGNK